MTDDLLPQLRAASMAFAFDVIGGGGDLLVRRLCNFGLVLQDIEERVEFLASHILALRESSVDCLTYLPHAHTEKQERAHQKGFVDGLQIQLRNRVAEIIQRFSIERPASLPKRNYLLPITEFRLNGRQDGRCVQRDIGRNYRGSHTFDTGVSGLNAERQDRTREDSESSSDGLNPARDVAAAGRPELHIIDSKRDCADSSKGDQYRGEDKGQNNIDSLRVLHGVSLGSGFLSYIARGRKARP